MPKICVVGAGRWGKNHVRTLNELGHLAGLVDLDETRLSVFKKEYPQLGTFADLNDALHGGFDGFTVASPAATHYPLAKKILEAGFPVLVEKPLALSSADARDLARIADEQDQQVMVGHLMLFHPAIVKIKELLQADKIGKIQYIYSNRINLGTVRTEENILWSFAPHDISMFQFLLECNPIEVVSRGGAFLQPHIHDTTMTTLRYPGNVMCHNYVSWLHPFKEHRIVIIGAKGMLSFDDSSEHKPLHFYEKGIDWIKGDPITRDGATEIIDYEDSQPLTEELQYFVENMHGNIEKADVQSAIEVLEILEQATTYLGDSVTDRPTPSTNIHPSGRLGPGAFVHPSSYIDQEVIIGANSKVWHFSHIQANAQVGSSCSLGQNVNVGNAVRIGNHVRIQNNVSVFEGVEIEDFVFCGPSMTFTNVAKPRAKYPHGSNLYARTLVREGATIGANATIVCGHTVGRHAFIAAGAVVTQDVPDHALMVGVPAKQIGWMTEGGERIPMNYDGHFECATSGKRYMVSATTITEITTDEPA